MARATHAVGGFVYHLLCLVLGTAVRLYYRRIETRHPERVPAGGPLLIVANHPASLTDVLVLGAAIRRRLHFVAYSGLFSHPLMGFVLRLAGTIPVYRKQDAADQMHRNEETFRACNELLEGGGAVLIFPEGTSMSDRRVERLKTGAARVALAYTFRGAAADDGAPAGEAAGSDLVLLPIGLHFHERTAFRSDVVLSVGRPIELEMLRDLARSDPQQAVRELTDRIQAALEKLILLVPTEDLATLVRDIERMYLTNLRDSAPAAPDLAIVRAIADSVEFFRTRDPERLHRIWIAVAAYQRKLAVLDLRDKAVREIGASGSGPASLVARSLLGLLPALAGTVVNWVPYRLSGIVGGWFADDATRIAFSRIMSGVVLFPATYGGIAYALRHWAGWGLEPIGVLLAACIPLGVLSLAYFRWLRRERHRLRLSLLVSANPRLVARVRSERRRIVQLLDAARDDYLTSLAATGEDT